MIVNGAFRTAGSSQRWKAVECRRKRQCKEQQAGETLDAGVVRSVTIKLPQEACEMVLEASEDMGITGSEVIALLVLKALAGSRQ